MKNNYIFIFVHKDMNPFTSLPDDVTNVFLLVLQEDCELTFHVLKYVNKYWEKRVFIDKTEEYIIKSETIAEKGYLELLKWAIENGCSWDEATCTASMNGH